MILPEATGSKIDVLVSSTGDAKSLVGGTLLLKPLRAPNGEIYAAAQGPKTLALAYYDIARDYQTGLQQEHFLVLQAIADGDPAAARRLLRTRAEKFYSF